MDTLTAARAQMEVSLGFHMIFAALGIGMPLLMVLAEALHLRTGQAHYRDLARTWGKVTALLFVVGAVSGTALSFELGLLWPRFMAMAGSAIGTYFQAPHLWSGLTSARAIPVLLCGFGAALVSGHALLVRRPRLARVAAIVQVVALLVGWALAQRPYLVYPDLTLEATAAEPATMRFVLGSLPIGAALIVPSLWLLFRVFKSEARGRGAG